MIDDAELMRLNAQFWHAPTVDDLIAEQSPRVIQSLDDFAAPWWPDEESTESFDAFLMESRAEPDPSCYFHDAQSTEVDVPADR